MKGRLSNWGVPLWRNAVTSIALLGLAGGCGTGAESGPPARRNNLEAMDTARITINGQPFEVWLATKPAEQELGLMHVRQEELAPIIEDAGERGPVQVERGMLFVFRSEMPLSFWMRNTIIPLDIAYIRGDGQIVRVWTMAPLETRTYPSVEPAQFALEVRAGLLAEKGITPGTHVEIPESVLKGAR